MNNITYTKRLILILFSWHIFMSCTNTYVDKIERGSNYKYQPGFPELRSTATSFIDQNKQTSIKVVSEIVYGSLVYKKKDGLFSTTGIIEYRIVDKNNNNTVKSLQNSFTINSESNKLSYDQNTYRITDDLIIEPGLYDVIVSVIDSGTGKQTGRSIEVLVPDPENEHLNITNIQMFNKIDSSYNPVTTYNISNASDSLKFVFQITNNNSEASITINSKLVKFKSDTSFAKMMNFRNYYTGSIEYKGIDYSESEELYTNRRIITNKGFVLIEYTFSKLKRGNYRFEIFANKGNENELFKARDFSIKSKSYPTLKTPEELARPLIYLMSEKEYQELMSISDPVEMKRAIDLFWLTNIKNSKTAKSVVELYYERVEEANKQFSNFKEGWKTDQGMVYILFGPPWHIDSSLNKMAWRYSYNLSDPEKNFYFEAPKLNNKYFPFDNYLLERSPSYYGVQYQQVELWRNGRILTRQ